MRVLYLDHQPARVLTTHNRKWWPNIKTLTRLSPDFTKLDGRAVDGYILYLFFNHSSGNCWTADYQKGRNYWYNMRGRKFVQEEERKCTFQCWTKLRLLSIPHKAGNSLSSVYYLILILTYFRSRVLKYFRSQELRYFKSQELRYFKYQELW